MTDDPHRAIAPPPAGVRTTRRRGRMSPTKRDVLHTAGPTWMLERDQPWDVEALRARVGTTGPILVDIGVGTGQASRAWARASPDALVLAIELHRPGLARLLTDLEADGPPNVRVVEADALEVLRALPPGSVTAVRALFPDPWPKRRHVRRRLVDRGFVELVARLLDDDGTLHLATDWADYADHMRSMVATEPRLRPVPDAGRPDRPTTAYEQRGIDAGRQITDLVYRRAPRPDPG